MKMLSHAKFIFMILELSFAFLEYIFYKKENHEGVVMCFKYALLCFFFFMLFAIWEMILRLA